MSAEVPGFNEEPQNLPSQEAEQPQVPAELLAYIDRDIGYIEARLEAHRRENHIIQAVEEQLTQFQQLRQDVENGRFNGITSLLQSRRTEAEQALATSQQKLHPRGEMPGDEAYFALKDEILTGEELSKKVSSIVDDNERAWLEQSIALREQRQYEHTRRGQVMREINQNGHTVSELANLQQMIPQPPQEQ